MSSETLPFENALSELIGKIDSNLDSGDVIKDARRASAALDAILAKGDLVANAYDHFRNAPDRAEKSIDFRIGWDACLDALINARAAAPKTASLSTGAAPVAWECASPIGERAALAFLTSKPPTREHYEAQGWRVTPLYLAAPAAPRVTTERKTSNPHNGGTEAYRATEHFNEGWNACLDAQAPSLATDAGAVLTPADWRGDYERQARIGAFNLTRADERDEDCDAGDYCDPESQAAWMWYYRGRLDGECGVGSGTGAPSGANEVAADARAVTAYDLIASITTRPDLSEVVREQLRQGVLHGAEELTVSGSDFRAMAALLAAHPTEQRMSDAELEQFIRMEEQFSDCNETDVDHTLLLKWVRDGLLDCTHYVVTDKGNAVLDAARKAEIERIDRAGGNSQ